MVSSVRLGAALAVALTLGACGPKGPPVAVEAKHPKRTWIEAGSATPRPYVSPYETVSGCPTTLAQAESVDRVIERGCGPVRVTPDYRLEAGSLTIEAGARLEFEASAGLFIGYSHTARLEIRGEPDAPVVLTSASAAPTPGSWEGLRLFPAAAGSSLAHVELEYAGDRERSALYVEAPEVSVERMRLRDCAGTAVHVSGDGWLARYRGNTLSGLSSPVAMLITPASATAFEGDNEFPPGSRIHVLKGFIRRSGRWGDPGVPFIVTGVIDVAGADERATLEFAPGVELRFTEGAYINVGYYDPGELVAVGTAEKPIRFTAAQGASAWKGIKLYKRAVARFDHVEFERGGREIDRGVLFANGAARLSVVHSNFRDNLAGAVIYDPDVELEAFENNSFAGGARPLVISPRNLARVDPSNLFETGSVEVKAGTIREDTRWPRLEARVELLGDILVTNGATLTVEAGARLRVRDGFHLDIGELETRARRRAASSRDDDGPLRDGSGALVLAGTAARPISITGVSERRGTWGSVVVHGSARPCQLSHVALASAGGKSAIEVQAGATATLEEVSCARCVSPTLSWSCGATVHSSNITALDGTPAAIRSPTCAPGASTRSLERVGPQ